ncbi:MAG: hypothetical protein ACT4QE_25660 [Anaerolineales bacterium]
MNTPALKWFYTTPEKKPYMLSERLRNSFWELRLGSLWLDTVSAESPFAAEGAFSDGPVRLDWEINQWLRLTAKPEAPALADGVKVLLGRKPLLSYTDAEGRTVHEWWVQPDAAEKRWQAVQGKPQFGQPVRLDK